VAPSSVRRARFEPSLEQAVAARCFVSRVVADAGHPEAVHDVALAAGELTANAAEHGHTPFEVSVTLDGCIRIEVADGNPDVPVVRDIDTYDERGRGLALVELVSCRWGVDRTPTGKLVWAELTY
jgi:anti-sigma regulatory factor (Ser/Thr protein kinase)